MLHDCLLVDFAANFSFSRIEKKKKARDSFIRKSLFQNETAIAKETHVQLRICLLKIINIWFRKCWQKTRRRRTKNCKHIRVESIAITLSNLIRF